MTGMMPEEECAKCEEKDAALERLTLRCEALSVVVEQYRARLQEESAKNAAMEKDLLRLRLLLEP